MPRTVFVIRRLMKFMAFKKPSFFLTRIEGLATLHNVPLSRKVFAEHADEVGDQQLVAVLLDAQTIQQIWSRF
jgi:hypothetical protein